MIKKIAIGIVALLVIVAVAAYFLYSNLDSIIKAAIERYGTAATQAEVRLDKVDVSLTSGTGGLHGLRVGNPKGFSAPTSFVLGLVSVNVDTGSVTGNGPIVIHEVNVDKPQVTYERNDSGGNLEAIQKNAMAYAGGGGNSGGTGGTGGGGSASGGDSGGRKIIIENLYVRDGQIGITHPLLQGKSLSAALPTIHLTNIGKDKGGATPAEVAQQVIGAITNAAAKVASADLEKTLGASLKGAVGDKLKGAAPDIGGAAKGLLGK